MKEKFPLIKQIPKLYCENDTVTNVSQLPDGLDHGEPHPDNVDCVARPGDGHARHAVVAVAQNLDPHAFVGLNTDNLDTLVFSLQVGVNIKEL